MTQARLTRAWVFPRLPVHTAYYGRQENLTSFEKQQLTSREIDLEIVKILSPQGFEHRLPDLKIESSDGMHAASFVAAVVLEQ